jgi:hypothetical protein
VSNQAANVIEIIGFSKKMHRITPENLEKYRYWLSSDERLYIQIYVNSDPSVPQKNRSQIKMFWIHPYAITLHDGVDPKRAWYCDEKRALQILKKLKMRPTQLKLFLTGGCWYE